MNYNPRLAENPQGGFFMEFSNTTAKILISGQFSCIIDIMEKFYTIEEISKIADSLCTAKAVQPETAQRFITINATDGKSV